MTWIDQGGLLMWPLLFLSVVALAVILDRMIVFSTLKLPNDAQQTDLLDFIKKGRVRDAEERAKAFAPEFVSLVNELSGNAVQEKRERLATLHIEELIHNLDKRIGWLATTGRVAPLLGLLGTVLGMIHTFSSLSAVQGGALDMTLLADGIWQALITTASGLIVAIPCVMAHQACVRSQEAIAFKLTRFANLALDPGEEKK
nr:MotA/TolQ/ExbB proton channel family protein [uncultured Desulfobacter sp.]